MGQQWRSDQEQMFNQIAGPILYRSVITDSPHGLTEGHRSPAAHPAIPSKSDLIHRIVNLSLEYPDMNEPTKSIDRHRIHNLHSISKLSGQFTPVLNLLIFARDVADCLHVISNSVLRDKNGSEKVQGGTEKVQYRHPNRFEALRLSPFLQRLVFAWEPDIWLPDIWLCYAQLSPINNEVKDAIRKSQQAIAYFVRTMKPKHFCQRPFGRKVGPLALPPSPPRVGYDAGSGMTMTSHQNTMDYAPLAFGNNLTFRFELPAGWHAPPGTLLNTMSRLAMEEHHPVPQPVTQTPVAGVDAGDTEAQESAVARVDVVVGRTVDVLRHKRWSFMGTEHRVVTAILNRRRDITMAVATFDLQLNLSTTEDASPRFCPACGV